MNWRRVLGATTASVLLLGGLIWTAFAAPEPGFTVAPFTYSALGLGDFTPGGGPAATARWVDLNGNDVLLLSKNVPTSEVAAAGAQLEGVKGLPTTDLTLSFTLATSDSYCGAGAPRFNVRLTNGQTIFLGCIYGNDGSGKVSFTAGQTYGGVTFPSGQTVDSIEIIQDEQGTTYLDDITVQNPRHTVIVGGPGNSRSQ